MHKSKVSTFVFDCQTKDLESAAKFWSQALNRPLRPFVPEEPKYWELDTRPDEPIICIQAVDHASRIHLDIASDDLEAEVRRLEALGAKRIEFVKRWWVMEAPTGQRFCVINPQRGPLEDDANQWP